MMATASTSVRVQVRTRESIARLARERGVSAAELLDELVSRAEDDALLAAMNEDFSRLGDDTEAWAAYESERDAWEATLLDGLADR
jgi:hypothetical protein